MTSNPLQLLCSDSRMGRRERHAREGGGVTKLRSQPRVRGPRWAGLPRNQLTGGSSAAEQRLATSRTGLRLTTCQVPPRAHERYVLPSFHPSFRSDVA